MYMPYYPMINPYGYVCLLLQTSLQDVSSGLEHLLHCAAQQRRLSLARFALRLGAEVRGHMRWKPLKFGWWINEDIMYLGKFHHDLTVLPHWNHGFYRGIIPFYGGTIQVGEIL